jgi:hypothetical protein
MQPDAGCRKLTPIPGEIRKEIERELCTSKVKNLTASIVVVSRISLGGIEHMFHLLAMFYPSHAAFKRIDLICPVLRSYNRF